MHMRQKTQVLVPGMSGGALFNAATASSEKGGYADVRRGSEGIYLKNQVLDEKSRIFASSKENLAIISDKGESTVQ